MAKINGMSQSLNPSLYWRTELPLLDEHSVSIPTSSVHFKLRIPNSMVSVIATSYTVVFYLQSMDDYKTVNGTEFQDWYIV